MQQKLGNTREFVIGLLGATISLGVLGSPNENPNPPDRSNPQVKVLDQEGFLKLLSEPQKKAYFWLSPDAQNLYREIISLSMQKDQPSIGDLISLISARYPKEAPTVIREWALNVPQLAAASEIASEWSKRDDSPANLHWVTPLKQPYAIGSLYFEYTQEKNCLSLGFNIDKKLAKERGIEEVVITTTAIKDDKESTILAGPYQFHCLLTTPGVQDKNYSENTFEQIYSDMNAGTSQTLRLAVLIEYKGTDKKSLGVISRELGIDLVHKETKRATRPASFTSEPLSPLTIAILKGWDEVSFKRANARSHK